MSIINAISDLTFSGIPSNAAYDGLKRAWKILNHQEWETLFENLFIDTFERAIYRQRWKLASYVRDDGTVEIDRDLLRQILRQDLGQPFDQMTYSQITNVNNIEILIDAITQKTALILGGNMLLKDEYRSIIQELIQRVKNELKLKVLADPDVYSRIMLDELVLSNQLLVQLTDYLRQQFNLIHSETYAQESKNENTESNHLSQDARRTSQELISLTMLI